MKLTLQMLALLRQHYMPIPTAAESHLESACWSS